MAGILKFNDLSQITGDYYDYYLQLLVFLNLTWLLLTGFFKAYDIKRTEGIRRTLQKLLRIFVIYLFVLSTLIVSLKGYYYSRLFLLYFYGFFAIAVLLWRTGFLSYLRYYRSKGYNFRKIILIGSGPVLHAFYDEIQQHPEYGLKLLGYFTDEEEVAVPVTGTVAMAGAFALKEGVDEFYCSFPPGDKRMIEFAKFADHHLIRFRLIPDLGLQHLKNIEIEFYGETPVLISRKEPLELFHNRIIKRIFDLVFSLLVMLAVFPWLFPLVAIFIKLDSKGPVFFRQKRSGLKNDIFYCYKFRTLQVNEDADKQQVRKDDPRITRAGRFLRRHNLDELPQFFNVLIGNMSVVGPRPHMLSHTEQYSELIEGFMVRHFIKPGITGLAQSRGLRGETTDASLMKERVKVDVYYLENWSLLLDINIILTTIYKMIKGDEHAF